MANFADSQGNHHVVISKIDIKELKGIEDCCFNFDKRLIAIMGVNGIGKSTIIHALACCFKPVNAKGERSKFSSYFPKSPNGEWKNSKFFLHCNLVDDQDNVLSQRTIEYGKNIDRWTPRYDRQLSKNIQYIGIASCKPAIEDFKGSSISYNTKEKTGRIDEKVVQAAATILNKDYECLTENITGKRSLIGVRTKTNLAYSALSMGAGEQRLITILDTLYNADYYSLILIDEIDLLLHPKALKLLIKLMSTIAEEKKLQIVFTTHSLVMNEVKDYVSVKYLDRSRSKIIVYNDIISPAWDELTGNSIKPISIFVEDDFSQAIVMHVAAKLNMCAKVSICPFGAASNGFVIAAAKILGKENVDNTLILTDGDVLITDEQRKKEICKHITGTEANADTKREQALGIIKSFQLPENTSPEQYLHTMLSNSSKPATEIISFAQKINAVSDSHQWINSIVEHFDRSARPMIIQQIIEACSGTVEWNHYVQPIYEWLQARQNL